MLTKVNENSDIRNWLEKLKEFQLDSLFETSVLARAYEYLPLVRILNENANQINLEINSAACYSVQLRIDKGIIEGTCSCPYLGNCKHLAAGILTLMKVDLNR